MRGYRFLISAFYRYRFKTIRIRILSVQTLLTAIILTVSVVLIMARWHRESSALCVTGVPIWHSGTNTCCNLYTTYCTKLMTKAVMLITTRTQQQVPGWTTARGKSKMCREPRTHTICCKLLSLHVYDAVCTLASRFLASSRLEEGAIAPLSFPWICPCDRGVVRSCDPLQILGAPVISLERLNLVVKFCTQVGYINSSNRVTYHQQKGRDYGHVIVFKFSVSRDAAHRAGLSATAELFVGRNVAKKESNQMMRYFATSPI